MEVRFQLDSASNKCHSIALEGRKKKKKKKITFYTYIEEFIKHTIK